MFTRKNFLTFLFFIVFVPGVWAQTETPDPASAAADPAVPSVSESAPVVESPAVIKTVKSIEVKGNKSISTAKILAKIKIRAGQEYVQNIISDDIKRLYNTGFFSDVRVDREDVEGGFRVVFQVTEKAIVDKITFSKLRYYRPRALQRKLKTQEGQFLDNKSLNDDIRTVEDLYAKKGLTQVKVTVEKDVDELTNKVKVHFVVEEGQRVKIRRIRFSGNAAFKAKRLIKAMKSRPAWLFNSGFLKQEVLDEDMDRLTSFYEKEGFIDAKVDYAVETGRPGRVVVRVTVQEGRRYYVDALKIRGNAVISEPEITAAVKEVPVGGVFSRERLSLDISNIRTLYFDRGYIFANVKDSTSLNPQTGQVEITLDVEEGELAYVNRIKIQGNDRTRDIVVRREMRLYPGDRFDGEKLRRSKQRLRNLGYFDEISYDIGDTDLPNKKDLIVQVKEAKTGSLSFGGGYSTIDQFVGFVEVEQKNFDFTNWPSFTGGGQQVSLRAEAGSTRSNTRLSFTEPWLFDYPVSAGFDAYITERNRESDVGYAFDEKRVGGDLRLGKSFTEYITGGVTYRLEEITIDNFDTGVSADLLAEEGKNTVSSLSFNLARDTRDNVFNPTTGLYLNTGVDVAGGVLSGDKDFYRLTQRVSYNIPFKFDSVLEFGLRAGMIERYGDTEKVPIFERFYAGGARTIRGYDERRVGPLDPVTDDPIGGNSMMIGNMEYTIPVIEFIKLAAFVDSGNVWSKVKDFASGGFKSGAGMGLRIKTPIGPVNLDYGYPLNKEPGEETRSGKFYFSVSRGF